VKFARKLPALHDKTINQICARNLALQGGEDVKLRKLMPDVVARDLRAERSHIDLSVGGIA